MHLNQVHLNKKIKEYLCIYTRSSVVYKGIWRYAYIYTDALHSHDCRHNYAWA